MELLELPLEQEQCHCLVSAGRLPGHLGIDWLAYIVFAVGGATPLSLCEKPPSTGLSVGQGLLHILL